MQILPVQTRLLKKGDDPAQIFTDTFSFEDNDIIVISSKAVATCERAMIDLEKIQPSKEAKDLSVRIKRSPAFCEAMLGEIKRLHGRIINTCPGAALTEIRPDGLKTGAFLVANAGLDESNAESNHAIPWPADTVKSAKNLRSAFEAIGKKHIAVIITDSCCMPRRKGVTAVAMVVAGIDPIQSEIGNKDLFGKPMTITNEAVADQLATAANFVMGNAGQSVPAAVIRDHGLAMSDFCGWVEGIDADEDLFRGMT